MTRRIRAAFVGAGNRAFSAYYPTVARLSDEVELVVRPRDRAYIDELPRSVRFLIDNSGVAEEVTGAQFSGTDDPPTYEGVVEMYRHFLACLRDGRPATSSIDDALETMWLVERIEQGRGAEVTLAAVR